MFVIGQMPRFSEVATISLPSPEDPAVMTEYSVTLVFEAMGIEAAKKVDAAARELKTDDAVEQHYRDFIRGRVRGWDGVVDGAGKPVPYTPALFNQVLDFPGFAAAAMAAYRVGLSGGRAKN